MSRVAWTAILETCAEVDALVARAAGDPGGPAALAAHGAEVRASVDRLRARLTAPAAERGAGLAEHDAHLALLPLALHLDERALGRLPEDRRLAWPLLQRGITGADRGGELFYELAEHLAARGDAPALAIEALCYCLADGFRGDLADDPARIAAHRARLCARLERPAPPPAPPRSATPLPRVVPAPAYALAVLVALALIALAMRALTDLDPALLPWR